MGSTKLSALMGALMSAAAVSAHGYVSHVIVDGVQFPGFNPSVHPYMSNPPTVIGWAADQPDLGFVSPSSYTTPDIICHKSGTPAKGHVQVRAGSSITLQWTPWPESHHGPIIDWLAPCNGPCQNVNKADLRFFKITGQGLITPGAPGYYAANKLMDQNDAWSVKIPENIKPGHYVLRHEIIALHGSGAYDGTQSYPQCFNLEIVGGSGTTVPAGVPGTQLYSDRDPGILLNTYDTTLVDYPVPGGPIVAGGVSAGPQDIQRATATGVPTPANGGGGPAPTTNNPVPTTTLVTRTTSAAPTTTSSASGAAQTPYGQCGGIGWTGPTTCSGGISCKVINDWYHQCAP